MAVEASFHLTEERTLREKNTQVWKEFSQKRLISSQNTKQINLSVLDFWKSSLLFDINTCEMIVDYKDWQNNKNIAGRKEVQTQPTQGQNTLCCYQKRNEPSPMSGLQRTRRLSSNHCFLKIHIFGSLKALMSDRPS